MAVAGEKRKTVVRLAGGRFFIVVAIAPRAPRNAQFHFHARGHGHIDERVEREQVDLAAHEVGHARLRDAEDLRGLCLAQRVLLDVLLECDHEVAAQRHVLRRFGRGFERIPDAVERFDFHASGSGLRAAR
ncbi:hypothetical protein PT2222_10518 [Paraburkholderia tropica]